MSSPFTIEPVPAAAPGAEPDPRLAAVPSAAARLAFYRVLGNSPAALQGFLSLKDALASGKLAPIQRESLAVRVAQSNGCGYCLSAHVGALRRFGASPDDVRAAREGRAQDERTQALLDVAGTLLRFDGSGRVDPEPALRARALGVSDEELLETAAHVALNVFSNAVNLLAATPIDLPEVPLELEETPASASQ